MSTRQRLAAAFNSEVFERLDRGRLLVRVPEITSPMPLDEMLPALLDRDHLRVGVLVPGFESGEERVTTMIKTVIDWRNDATVQDAIVVIGNIEHHGRAGGLKDEPPIKGDAVRRRLFGDLIEELRNEGAPLLAIRFLRLLADTTTLVDLAACSRYCDTLVPVDASTGSRTKSALWMLGLLPDVSALDIDRRRLTLNSQMVARLRSMDAGTRQRLIRHLEKSSSQTTDYTNIRLFAATGEVSHLAGLDLEQVQEALKSTAAKTKKGGKKGEISGVLGSLVEAALDSEYDEPGFVSQVSRHTADGNVQDDRSVSVGTTKLEWEFRSLDPVSTLLANPDDEAGYESQAGSVETIRWDESLPQPGKGDVEWRSLAEIGEQLRTLEARATTAGESPADIVDELVSLRRALLPVLESIPAEGVRLFLLSKQYRSAATALVDKWVSLWRSLGSLRARLSPEDHFYVRRTAERLASTDLRVTRQGANVDAYVLPLHPVMLEPRVRAAELFLAADDPSDDFFELVSGSLDPAVPSISTLFDGAPTSLGYAGEYKGLLHYSRTPRQVDSADVDRTLREIVQRFLNVHPFATLSLSVALFDPPPKTAKALLRWLGEHGADRVTLRVYTTRRDDDDLRAALDEAEEELTSGEVLSSKFDFDVLSIRNLADLPIALSGSDHLPHMLFTFDIGDIEQSSAGFKFSSQPLGSLVSEWVFDTDPLEHARPVIRPRSGSNRLTDFLTSQAGVFEMSLPSQQRSPLLSVSTERAIEALGALSTWVVLCEGISALVPPTELGDLHLVGRMGSGGHVAFVYSGPVVLLLEPVVRYLLQTTWFEPDRDAVLQFLLGTIRMALPEGLLGFFKARGDLSKESVLGRLGFAAALAYLNEAADGHQLIVSLDTEGARRWLGLRDGTEKRADMVAFRTRADGTWDVEAVEVKARTDTASWANSPPESVVIALQQVREMEHLLEEIFNRRDGDAFTPSRREILKRQVFLEAFQQWEPLRLRDESKYSEQIAALNDLFGTGIGAISRRVILVSPVFEGEAEHREVLDQGDTFLVTTIGVPWLRRAIEARPGGIVEIPAGLLDELGLDEGREGAVDGPFADESRDEATGTAAASRDSATRVDQGDHETMESAAPDVAEESSTAAVRLREIFVARNAPFKTIETDQIVVGPTVIQIPFTVPVGAKLAQLVTQEEDIARDMGVQSVRISNWAGRPGFAVAELPRRRRDIPDVTTLEAPTTIDYPTLALGAQLDFAPYWVSLDELPHLLVAGTTGSGKSVFLRSLLWQLTQLVDPSRVDLVLIDAKGMADYLDFGEAPHIKSRADFHAGVSGAIELLEEIVGVRLPERTLAFRQYAADALRRDPPAQMTNLRQLMSDCDARGIPTPIRPLVVVIDEFAELVLGSSERKRFETAVTRFVGIARAIGGHLIAATQRPSTDVVTGVMKANFARVGLRVQQSVDSRVILDENGAETLLGRGDLLFKSANVGLVRLQGYAALGPYRF